MKGPIKKYSTATITPVAQKRKCPAVHLGKAACGAKGFKV